jgi:hypothetical protein
MTDPVTVTEDAEQLVPMNRWGKDHWSTLAYVEHVAVECAGFQVGSDARMKSNRRHTRLLSQGCPNPKRAKSTSAMGMIMRPEHATKLKDGTLLANHDDWACLQDFVAEGLFKPGLELEPGTVLAFSERGHALTAALRVHKASGGQFAQFDPEAPPPNSEAATNNLVLHPNGPKP